MVVSLVPVEATSEKATQEAAKAMNRKKMGSGFFFSASRTRCACALRAEWRQRGRARERNRRCSR